MPAGKPPLELAVEVTLADGSRKRWDSDSRAADRPQGMQFRTRQGDGFSDASCTLARRIDTDYIDLNVLDDVAFIGDDGTTAYEGRVTGIPRSFGDMHSVTVNCAGWMAHARDRKFTEIYVDRDFGSWGDMPLNEKVRLATASVSFGDFSWTQEAGALVCALPNQALGTQTVAETWYTAPVGVTVGKVAYLGTETSLPAGWDAPTLYNVADDARATATANAATFDSTLRTISPAVPRRYLIWQHYSNGNASTPAAGSNRRISKIGVYGNHGLTTRTIDSTTPDGVYASDVISDIALRFCPKLSTTGVVATTFPIPHLAFKDPTDPYDAFLDVNKYHLWDLGVWENKTLTFRPNDLSDYDWEIRESDLGTTIDLQGDSADDLANGFVVNYTDVATGLPARLTPTDDTTLADTSANNLVNTHGLIKWPELTLSSPTTAAAAAQIGRIALAEFNLPKAPGTITVTGHIKDRAGHWQQAWRVRAGDTIAITDHPDDRPRIVTETTWDHDSKTLTISVEGPAHRLDAVLDRITTDLVAANLS